MITAERSISLGEEEFRLIRDLIRDFCGIYFEDSSRSILEKRLSRRVIGHHFESFRDYYRLLRYDRRRDDELASIMDVLTVNETYFFREQNQLRAFSEEILPEFHRTWKESKRLRIWSAGCATGEEPYTVAMLILESGLFHGWDVEVVGSDINQRVLHVAREGTYGRNSFRMPMDRYISRYFTAEGKGTHRVVSKVRGLVGFSYLNLLDPFKYRFLGHFDIIFCRNVMIYFDLESRKRLVQMFFDRLNGSGYLLLGHAESLINISTAYRLRHLKNDMVYQKPDHGEAS